jgi:hypothetical protein
MDSGKGGDDGSQGKAMGKGMKESISRLFDQIRLLIVWGGLEILKPIAPDKHRFAIMQAIVNCLDGVLDGTSDVDRAVEKILRK